MLNFNVKVVVLLFLWIPVDQNDDENDGDSLSILKRAVIRIKGAYLLHAFSKVFRRHAFLS